MKMKRMVASVLALLLVVSILPMAAMADTIPDNPKDKTLDEVDFNQVMNLNEGTVEKNFGEIKRNGTVTGGPSSGQVNENRGKIENNYGTVGTNVRNAGEIESNYGTVETNNYYVTYNNGTVDTNNHRVETNNGIVTTNNRDVETNNKTVATNNGYVSVNSETGTVGNNKYIVSKNYGQITTNDTGGTVYRIDEKGTVGTNKGTVNINNGKVTVVNSGEVEKNCGTIEKNTGDVGHFSTVDPSYNSGGNYGIIIANEGRVLENGGEVRVPISTESSEYVNREYNGTIVTNVGTVIKNNENSTIQTNKDTVGDNAGTVNYNFAGGTVDTNNGTVDTNNGTVIINAVDGTVGTNNNIVRDNYGKVETNTINGVVHNKTTDNQNGQNVTGTVTNNYGTVYNFDEEKNGYVATYGVQVRNTDGGTGTGLLQAVENTVNKLADLFKRDGYKVVGYEDLTDESNVGETSSSDFKATRPSILSLIWKAIVKPAAPAAPTVDEAVPTSYDPNYIGLGSVIYINEKGYKVVEIKDDAYVVVTFDALPDEDVADLNALYARLFTPEQQKLVKNMGQLLDSEDVLTIFGKPGNHPVYEVSKDLVK